MEVRDVALPVQSLDLSLTQDYIVQAHEQRRLRVRGSDCGGRFWACLALLAAIFYQEPRPGPFSAFAEESSCGGKDSHRQRKRGHAARSEQQQHGERASGDRQQSGGGRAAARVCVPAAVVRCYEQ